MSRTSISILLAAYCLTFVSYTYGQGLAAEEFFNQPLLAAAGTLGGNPAGTAPRMPWIERYEIRTETRDFEPTRQEFTLRTRLSTPGLRRAQTQYYQRLNELPDTESFRVTCRETEDRYAGWLELYRIDELNGLLNDLEVVLTDKQTVLLRLAQTLDFEWRELIDARTELTDLTIRRSELRRKRELLLERFGFSGRTPSFDDFREPDELTSGRESIATADEREIEAELALVAGELAIEEAERKRYFRYAQARYQGDDRDPFREEFALSVGFQLPNSGGQKIKQRELELDRLELERERELNRLVSDRLQTGWNDYLRQELQLIQEQNDAYATEAEELATISANLSAALSVNPLLLLRIRERNLRNRQRLLDRRADLYDDYLDYLEDAALLCERPDGSWLR